MQCGELPGSFGVGCGPNACDKKDSGPLQVALTMQPSKQYQMMVAVPEGADAVLPVGFYLECEEGYVCNDAGGTAFCEAQ